MLRSLPGAIDDALDTLYEPTAIFSQFLGSASMTFLSLFLSLLPLRVLSFWLFFYCLSFFVFSLLCLFFPFLSFIFFSFIFFSLLCFFFPIDLRPSCMCVVISTTCNMQVVVFLGWQAVISRFFRARVVRRMHQYGPGRS